MEKVSKKRGKIITDREELLVCQQYKDGWTLRKIATYANISQTTVMAILRRREIPLRNGKQITEEQEKQVIDLSVRRKDQRDNVKNRGKVRADDLQDHQQCWNR